MRKLGLFIFSVVLATATLQAQNIIKSLEQKIPGQGTVTIHQDPAIEALLGVSRNAQEGKKVIKTSGFRVQAYAGNNTRRAMNEAHEVAAKIKEHFPDLPVYTTFNSPRWLCRVGDFHTIEEADAVMRKIRATGIFKEVSIVKDNINIEL